jgi:aminoglycoside phosphotransferase (APT) family kinase protein
MSSVQTAGSLSDITPSWLTRALRRTVVSETASVTAVTSESIGAGVGFSGSLARLRLAYHPSDIDAPQTVFAKFPEAQPTRRMLLDANNRELRFYRELAQHVAMPSPRCYYSHLDTDDQRWMLLLEDLGHLRGDQVAKCSLADAERTVVALARFHAGLWNSPRLADFPWILAWDRGAQLFQLRSRYGWQRLMEMAPLPPALEEFVHKAGQYVEAIRRRLSRPPVTVTHGDFKLDNLFFGISGPVALDWALLRVGRGIYDLSFFFVSSMTAETRRAHLGGLLGLYHETLVVSGVTQYTVQDCHEDYGYAVLDQGSRLQAIKRFNVENTRGREWVEVMMERVADALSCVDTEILLSRLA